MISERKLKIKPGVPLGLARKTPMELAKGTRLEKAEFDRALMAFRRRTPTRANERH